MVVQEFTYKGKARKVIVLHDDMQAVSGIDMQYLSGDQQEELKALLEQQYADLEPFRKAAFRKFLKTEMTEATQQQWGNPQALLS